MALLAIGLLAGSPDPGRRSWCWHVLHPQVGLRGVLLLRRAVRLSPLAIQTFAGVGDSITP